ncbi:hypothetical protein R5W24_001019 [Gemmata sp. JC717]|uniref:hypothetical protein n=1 Tax=Gemmata algarum TaxID=2975278 RepID=UPI0021BADD1E|nr:hypothetical protein [Gemmata algarum]MDY3551939.1 hypothetical protein [Gemmata algarum]
MPIRPLLALAGLLLAAGPASAQLDPPDPAPGAPGGGISPTLRSTLDALGASVGVPDGFGYSWSPRAAVRGQRASMGLSNYQFGLTLPVYESTDDLVFADASVRALDIRTNALLPTDRVAFPRSLWDVQAGGGYVGQLGADWSWGATLNVGSASDRPFNSLNEMTLSALAFARRADGDRNGWLFYVVSTSNGQLGRNIPVPGVAYEFHTDRLTAVVGFPFVSVDYRPTREWQFEFNYGALTDVLARASYHPTEQWRLFTAFEWTNQTWFRAGRRGQHRQLFFYEKRLEAGFGWRVHQNVDFTLTPGYAFDRLFVESRGFGFRGRNRTDLAPARFLAVQFELKY